MKCSTIAKVELLCYGELHVGAQVNVISFFLMTTYIQSNDYWRKQTVHPFLAQMNTKNVFYRYVCLFLNRNLCRMRKVKLPLICGQKR